MTKVLRYSATLLLSMALLLLVGGSAAAQSGENSRYRQFRDTAAASISNPSSGNVRLFFDSTGFYWKNSAGVATAVGGGGLSGLTTGVVPQAGSATTIVNSKMVTSGTNSGTWTLYDSTGGTGLTKLILRDGAGNSSAQAVLEPYADGTEFIGSTTKRFNIIAYSFGTVSGGPPGGMLLGSGTSAFRYYGGSVSIGSTATFDFSTGDPAAVGNDLGFTRSAAGILKVTDGGAGSGGIGISDAATNTVTDALILKHATTDAGFGQDGFGTGLLFQGEDEAGNMQSMASIQAVYTDSANGSEDADLKFYGILAGTLTNIFNIVPTSGLVPAADNTYDIGTSAARVKDIYLSDELVFGASGTPDAAIVRIGAGILAQKSGSTAQTFRVYSAAADYVSIFHDSTDSYFAYNEAAQSGMGIRHSDGLVRFYLGGTAYWGISPSIAGGLYPAADNATDIGAPSNRVKDIYVSTSIQGTRTQTISDAAAAATFVTVAAATSNTVVGGRIFYTITAIDAGTASQTKTGTYSFGLNNIGGTVTGGGTDVLEHSQLSTGTLAPTFSVNISGTNAQFQLVLDTSLDAAAETLKIEYRVQIDSGTATVTPAT